ncbi:MAG: Snf7 family protein [Actinomycetales bacterium]
MATVAVHTAEEKFRQLRMRKEESRKLGAHIDALVKQAEGDEVPSGCSVGLCAFVRRKLGRGQAVRTVAMEAVRNGAHSNVEMHRAVFGLAGARRAADPAAKLDEAAQVMRARIAQLEERAVDQRKVASNLMKAGQKPQALRELKKAKAVEAQVEANQASLMAVEQQVDMLAQAAMQKTLASALATTSKSMKKDAKALGKAETAIEDAQEARDMATDLNQVMADFAGNGTGDVDEDELLAELEGMAAEDAEPPPPADAAATERARLAEIAELEAKLAERKASREQSETHRAAVAAMPSAPLGSPTANGASDKRKHSKEEKAGLLANASHSA